MRAAVRGSTHIHTQCAADDRMRTGSAVDARTLSTTNAVNAAEREQCHMKCSSLLTFAAIWLWCSLVPDLLQLPGAVIIAVTGMIVCVTIAHLPQLQP